jgi:hypothetical protein
LIVTDNVCGLYRGVLPMEALERRGHSVAWIAGAKSRDASRRALFGCDLVHTARGAVNATAVSRLQRAGVAVTWDIDDDIAAIPSGTAAFEVMGGEAGRQRILSQLRQVAARVDGITTTTARMASLYTDPKNAPVSVIDNAVAPWFLDTKRQAHRLLTVGWVAGGEHALDADALNIANVIGRLLQTHEHVRFVCVGIDLQVAHPRYQHCDFVPLTELPSRIAEFDIGIAPLCNTPLNLARSTIKVKEYAALGVPWLASFSAPFEGLGEREGGRLVRDGDWYEELRRLIKRGRLRRRLAERAREWARSESIDALAPAWEGAFEEAIKRARPRRASSPRRVSRR